VSFEKTRTALNLYDFEPTSGSADMVRVSFWLEASKEIRARIPNPTTEEIRAVIKLSEQHEWQFYANGSFCRKCGASIGSGYPCR
jgi:hypothetical protein